MEDQQGPTGAITKAAEQGRRTTPHSLLRRRWQWEVCEIQAATKGVDVRTALPPDADHVSLSAMIAADPVVEQLRKLLLPEPATLCTPNCVWSSEGAPGIQLRTTVGRGRSSDKGQ